MGAWSGEPFGNDTAGDWGWELEEASDWQPVRDALNETVDAEGDIDADVAAIAIAAAEVVAHGLRRATQDDSYTEEVAAFVRRASAPTQELVELALAGLASATGAKSELTELWLENEPGEWNDANKRLENALRGND